MSEPERKPGQEDRFAFLMRLKQAELDRLAHTMRPFPERTPELPIAPYERAVVMEEVFERISQGESVQLICMDARMPSRATVMNWLSEDVELQRRYDALASARARAYFELAIWEIQRACDPESMKIAEKRANAYFKAAALLDPKAYSDKTHTQLHKTGGNAPVAITLNIGAGVDTQSRELVVVPTHSDTHE